MKPTIEEIQDAFFHVAQHEGTFEECVTVRDAIAELEAARGEIAELKGQLWDERGQHTEALRALTEHAEAVNAEVRREIGEIREEVKRKDETLQKIANVKYGLDGTETDEELAEYWSKRAIWYEQLARAALSPKSTEGEG